MTIAVYPGSFDPVTNGHLDIAVRASAIFEELIVAVYDSPSKNLLFNTEERVALFSKATEGVPNIRVTRFHELTVDYAKRVNAKVLVRGLRAISDFELEMQTALLNRKMSPRLEVVCFMTSLEYSFLSSSITKEIASLGGCVDGLVPPNVAQALADKYVQLKDGAPVPRYLNT